MNVVILSFEILEWSYSDSSCVTRQYIKYGSNKDSWIESLVERAWKRRNNKCHSLNWTKEAIKKCTDSELRALGQLRKNWFSRNCFQWNFRKLMLIYTKLKIFPNRLTDFKFRIMLEDVSALFAFMDGCTRVWGYACMIGCVWSKGSEKFKINM